MGGKRKKQDRDGLKEKNNDIGDEKRLRDYAIIEDKSGWEVNS